jgi:hypothetical protein
VTALFTRTSGSWSSFGFGSGCAHLPQPKWYGEYSVEAQADDESSTLELYRSALATRAQLLTDESITWKNHFFNPTLVHFIRANGWHSITNFGNKPVSLPTGAVILASQPLIDGKLGPNTTAWVVGESSEGSSMDAATMLLLGGAIAGSSGTAGSDGGGFGGDGGAAGD